MSEATRRTFLQQTAVGLGAAALSAAAPAQAKDDKQRFEVGLIGPGGMGNHHLDLLISNPDVHLAYVCDPDEQHLAKAARKAEAQSGPPPKAVKDMREVFDDKRVDAVWIATPDHWHAPAAILACEAGKHVYVEKPCSHNIREGRLLIAAARKNKRVVQVGTQSRSTENVIKAVERVQQGEIGEVLVAKAWNSQLRKDIGHIAPSEPPDYLDYDLWIGPAPMRPYRTNLLPGVWRWWYDFGAGDLGNDGVHDLDVARWGLGVESHPSTISAMGRKLFFDDDQQFPDTQFIVFDYDIDGHQRQKRQLIYEQRIWCPYPQDGYENGAAFYGTKGYMLLGHTVGFQLYGRHNKLLDSATWPGVDLPAHHADFLNAIRSDRRPNADIEINHLSTALCHLGNIATRTGRVIHFDPPSEKIIGDEDANRFVHREYRDHWAVPKGV